MNRQPTHIQATAVGRCSLLFGKLPTCKLVPILSSKLTFSLPFAYVQLLIFIHFIGAVINYELRTETAVAIVKVSIELRLLRLRFKQS